MCSSGLESAECGAFFDSAEGTVGDPTLQSGFSGLLIEG
jgi:hypothetical protein